MAFPSWTVDSGITSQFQADAITLFCLDSEESLAGGAFAEGASRRMAVNNCLSVVSNLVQ